MGVTKLGRKEYKASIEEMHHADCLIERILFLGGLPNVQRLNQVLIGQTAANVLESDRKLEDRALADLREGIQYRESGRDDATRDLFRKILADEEEHADFIDRQFEAFARIGIERYTPLNSAPADADKGKEAGGAARLALPPVPLLSLSARRSRARRGSRVRAPAHRRRRPRPAPSADA